MRRPAYRCVRDMLEDMLKDSPMSRIACRLLCYSPGPHIQQVYTGLSMLHQRGMIDLTQDLTRRAGRPGLAQHLKDAGESHAAVVLNNRLKLHYDMHDAQEID